MPIKNGTKKSDKIIDLNHYKLQNKEVKKERQDNLDLDNEQQDNLDLDNEVIKELKRQTKKIIDG